MYLNIQVDSMWEFQAELAYHRWKLFMEKRRNGTGWESQVSEEWAYVIKQAFFYDIIRYFYKRKYFESAWNRLKEEE